MKRRTFMGLFATVAAVPQLAKASLPKPAPPVVIPTNAVNLHAEVITRDLDWDGRQSKYVKVSWDPLHDPAIIHYEVSVHQPKEDHRARIAGDTYFYGPVKPSTDNDITLRAIKSTGEITQVLGKVRVKV